MSQKAFMIIIKEAITKDELKTFVRFPFKLYKDSKYWVPPIVNQELETFNKTKNPIFQNAEARFFLAYQNNEVVGRIAAIINWLEVNNQQKKMRFGWFDFIDDKNVSKALLDKVEAIGMEHNLDYTEGPVGFSNLDKVGVITEGFTEVSKMITWYNHPYYPSHYIANGYRVDKSYSESKFNFKNVKPETFEKANMLIRKRYKLKALSFTKTKAVMPYVNKMFDLFNESYAGLSSFVEITEAQKVYFKKKFISFVNPEYIKFIEDNNKNLVAFAIVMPKFAKALQKTNGKLFPLGFLHFLKAKKNSTDVVFYLIGIHPSYQNKGLNAIIFYEYYKTFVKKGIKMCYRTPELDDNHAIHKIWKHFDPQVVIKRKTFRKDLETI